MLPHIFEYEIAPQSFPIVIPAFLTSTKTLWNNKTRYSFYQNINNILNCIQKYVVSILYHFFAHMSIFFINFQIDITAQYFLNTNILFQKKFSFSHMLFLHSGQDTRQEYRYTEFHIHLFYHLYQHCYPHQEQYEELFLN